MVSMKKISVLALAGLTALSGCSRDGDIDSTGGISVTRSACPAIAVPAQTGDITVFNPPTSRDARAIDVVANMTNVRSTCNETGEDVVASVTFDVQARRIDTNGAREIVIPYFTTIVRGGRSRPPVCPEIFP